MSIESISYIEIVQALESGEILEENIPSEMWNELGVARAELMASCKGEDADKEHQQ